MANSTLYGKTEYSVPSNVLQVIRLAAKQHPGNERAKHLLSKPRITYQNAKRLKNFLETANVDSPEYALAGGKEMLSWLNKELNSDRAEVISKKTTMNNAGFANQFRREHQRTYIKPSHINTSGMKPEKVKRNPLLEEAEKHNNPCSAAIGVIVNPDGKFLVVCRAKDDDWMPGKWALPGGGIEKGESASIALVREIREETNLEIISVNHLVDIKESNGTWCAYLMAVAPNPEEIKLNAEHSDYKWVTTGELSGMEMVPDMLDCVKATQKAYVEKVGAE